MALIIDRITGAWQDSVDDTLLSNPENYIIFGKSRPPTGELRRFLAVAPAVFAMLCEPQPDAELALIPVTAQATWGDVVGFIDVVSGNPALIPNGPEIPYRVRGFTASGTYPAPNADIAWEMQVPSKDIVLPDDDTRVAPVWNAIKDRVTDDLIKPVAEPDELIIARERAAKIAANRSAFEAWAAAGVVVLDLQGQPGAWRLPMSWTDSKFQENKAKAESYATKLLGLSGDELAAAQQQLAEIMSTMYDVDGRLQPVSALEIVANLTRITPKRLAAAEVNSGIEAQIQQAETLAELRAISVPDYAAVYEGA